MMPLDSEYANRDLAENLFWDGKNYRDSTTFASQLTSNPVKSNGIFHDDEIRYRNCVCVEAEHFHVNTVDPTAYYFENPIGKYYQKATIILLEHEPIGYVKTKGEKTFLATKSVMDSNGNYPLLKYGMYMLDKEFTDDLDIVEDTWGFRLVNALSVKFMRFLKPSNLFEYPEFSEERFVTSLEREIETFDELAKDELEGLFSDDYILQRLVS